ncbi:MAG: class I SAM-dependent methyltransferase [Patescibacteria group bacterium]|jgi:SAM-dependent methyltransferase
MRTIEKSEAPPVKDTREPKNSSEIINEIFQYLEERELIERKPDGVLIVDSQLLSRYDVRDALFRKLNGRLGKTRAEQIGNLFLEEKVVINYSEDEVVPIGSQKPEPLFYSPKSKEDAFDLEKIKGANFHFGLWEDYKGFVDKNGNTVEQPGATDGLSLIEASLACLIFHPKFGNGHRNEKGQLVVRRPNGQETVFSSNWLKEWPGMHTRVNEKNSRPLFEYFFTNSQTMAANLLEQGLLNRADFARTKEVRTSETRVSSNGMVSIDSVKHYLGRQYAGTRVEPLGEILAVIRADESGNETLVATSRQLKKGDVGLVQRKTATGTFLEAPVDLCQPIPFDPKKPHTLDDSADIEKKIEQAKVLNGLQMKLDFDNHLNRSGSEARLSLLPSFLQKKIQKNIANLPTIFSPGLKLSEEDGQDGLEIFAMTIDQPILFLQTFYSLKDLSESERLKAQETIKELCHLRLAVQHLSRNLGKKDSEKIGEMVNESLVKREEGGLEKLRTAVVSELATVLGAESLRVELQNAAETGEAYLKSVFEDLLRVMSPETPNNVKTSLRKLYKEIKFEQYKLNELSQQRDENFLRKNLQLGSRVADLGAGTGRLSQPLSEAGIKVTAVDNVQRHVDLMRRKFPKVEVVNADWTRTGLPNESQETVFSLGRSILHEFTLARQNALFREANRILQDGGKFIIDIPDRTKGNYAHLVESYRAAMAERNIPVREGLIYDSPDGQNFFTRYAYSLEDIRHLAEDNGFQIETTETAQVETGEGDENIYIVMKKVGQPKEQLPLAA